MAKTPITFYLDDTRPDGFPPDTFGRFLDFVESQGIAGESSVILSTPDGRLLTEPETEAQRAYIEQIGRAYECGIDTHVELMTHWGLYDFENRRAPGDVVHEGVWLHEPEETLEAYEGYLQHIVDEGDKVGVKFTGLTWPGCSCEACQTRYAELREEGKRQINPKVWLSLLNLVEGGRFRGPTVPCFIGGKEENPKPVLTASRGEFGVYDLRTNARDRFGLWLNELEHVDADYYISSDGERGRIVDLVHSDATYCLFYAHWQGLNPANGVGWEAFRTVISRIQKHLYDEVEWMRPSELTNRWHREMERWP